MQETHYNNPNLVANRADSSGMRLYYTGKLRPHDIGILEIGLEYSAKNSIPPGQANFELQGHCVPECTRVGLPERGINVVASQLHTHLTGEPFDAYSKILFSRLLVSLPVSLPISQFAS